MSRGQKWPRSPSGSRTGGLDLNLSLNTEVNILEGLEGERWNEVEDRDSRRENNHNATHRCTCMDGMTRARRT